MYLKLTAESRKELLTEFLEVQMRTCQFKLQEGRFNVRQCNVREKVIWGYCAISFFFGDQKVNG